MKTAKVSSAYPGFDPFQWELTLESGGTLYGYSTGDLEVVWGTKSPVLGCVQLDMPLLGEDWMVLHYGSGAGKNVIRLNSKVAWDLFLEELQKDKAFGGTKEYRELVDFGYMVVMEKYHDAQIDVTFRVKQDNPGLQRFLGTCKALYEHYALIEYEDHREEWETLGQKWPTIPASEDRDRYAMLASPKLGVVEGGYPLSGGALMTYSVGYVAPPDEGFEGDLRVTGEHLDEAVWDRYMESGVYGFLLLIGPEYYTLLPVYQDSFHLQMRAKYLMQAFGSEHDIDPDQVQAWGRSILTW